MESSSLLSIDWQQLLADLDADNSHHPAEVLQARLQQRAKAYAAAAEKEAVVSDEATYTLLTFRLGTERYALEVRYVRGVRPVSNLTRVPGTPVFYRGVVNVRGKIITVLDLLGFFGSGSMDATSRELILLSAAGLELALLADHIEDVTTIPISAAKPVEMLYAHGMTQDRLIILDIDALFSDERLIAGGKNG
jgi:purine-binding chemotaxis protein CheW